MFIDPMTFVMLQFDSIIQLFKLISMPFRQGSSPFFPSHLSYCTLFFSLYILFNSFVKLSFYSYFFMFSKKEQTKKLGILLHSTIIIIIIILTVIVNVIQITNIRNAYTYYL